jgi:hypothetical protein
VWRRLLNRLIRAWRQACGDAPERSVILLSNDGFFRHYGAVANGHQFRLMAQIRYDFLILK